ncbi:C40 family peptidase [Frigidibacter sp. RF13]|uniref:C40 family peptidase n=1 Tax=Frigidibacter sp. RF13 TaxID=2997340 RepID=UPI00226ED229|nr:C40 family peptidase [Frigidibacter sp. RF13]MCY1128130.1 C40 family peptidase [Frigidibacter sp. RF13]
MTDRRLLPANGRVAHVSLRGRVEAAAFVDGEAARVTAPLTDLLARPGGQRDRQVLRGDGLTVLERKEGHAFVQARKDGYCGYVAEAALGPDHAVTHWVSAPATHLYPAADIKQREVASLSFGAQLEIVGEEGRFARTADGHHVPRTHLQPTGAPLDDPAAVALLFLGTPYLWGGNSRDGIDCSGLVQAALLACGHDCPGDSDLQWESVGRRPDEGAPLRRGDLLFWRGHVAMAMDGETMIHANAHAMAVTLEPIRAAKERIQAAEGDNWLGAKRL